jgi:hypothetical protein
MRHSSLGIISRDLTAHLFRSFSNLNKIKVTSPNIRNFSHLRTGTFFHESVFLDQGHPEVIPIREVALGDKNSKRTRHQKDVSLPEEGNRHYESKDVASRLQ